MSLAMSITMVKKIWSSAPTTKGVIVVARAKPLPNNFKEVFKKANTFIHEIEIGDVDGDQRLEFFATPSEPNSSKKSQGGSVLMFSYDAAKKKFWKQSVLDFKHRHAKEIFLGDLDKDGKDELYVSLEAKSENKDGKRRTSEPLEIQRYTLESGSTVKKAKWAKQSVATLPGGVQARVLLAGDLKGEGKEDLVVTTWKDGVWRLVRRENGTWGKQKIDGESGRL